MEYSIGELRRELFSHVYDVHRIIEEYFGEDKVDLQGIPTDAALQESLLSWDCTETEHEGMWEVSDEAMGNLKNEYSSERPFVLVYWPEVTVTNEHDRSIDIQDLYAKIEVTMEGRIPYENRGFKLVRTTFPQKQFNDGYLHSHVPQFHGLPHYDNPCLGSGPINQTILDLKNNYDEMTWMLFCRELSLYVTVESLSGVPYNKLEYVGKRDGRILYGYDCYNNVSFNDFLRCQGDDTLEDYLEMITTFSKYYLEHGNLQLSFDGSKYTHGMPYFDFIIGISNSFIEWHNQYGDKSRIQDIYRREILIPVYVAGRKFYSNSNNTMSSAAYEGTPILNFKGESKTLHIIQEESETECTLILNKYIAMYILTGILSIINYRFNDEYNNRNRREGNSSTQEGVAETYKKVLYL